MAFPEQNLDLVLVPSGLLLMFGYHLFLLYRYIQLPHTTAIGFINSDAKAWAERIMKQEYSNRNLPLSVISSNVSAATYLATVSLTLSSLIGTWIASNSSVFQSSLVYGDRRSSTLTLKYISILICFLLAFSCFVHSTRKFVHANYLITMPNSSFSIGYVETPILRGNEFWWLGLRALYFALDLLMWFFGPIPMFVSSAAMVLLLQSLDFNSTPLHHYDRAEKKVEEGVDRTGIALAATQHRRG
ncbi:hypothetical protein Nepgr_028799 [Nepenthes gracilis]|uniref:DUF599 domain-containing protein n=1 Tax=Nepenthes gracilis TaxID=150966 RepID=A0AAD3Y4X5_NEPGR|nr:hypothetical protein Nepgr_028799 [Nepenthes gracilis]